MEDISCIICNSVSRASIMNISDRFTGEYFQVVECVCGFKYLSPRPDNNEIKRYYDNVDYDPHRSSKTSVYGKIYGWIQAEMLKWKFNYINNFIQNGTLLDIGGGGGEFASFFHSNGWQVAFQDNSKKAQKLAKNKNLSAYSSLSDIQNIKFDLITMWHSLEHIHDIEDLFANIERLACPNGMLVIAIPNLNAPERKWFGKNWAPWDVPRHLYHFNFKQLKTLLYKYGWKIQSSKSMLQDTPYNILLSLRSQNPIWILLSGFILFYSYIKILIGGVNASSSFMVICKKI